MLPVFILILATLIGISVFHFTSFKKECEIQRQVVDTIQESNSIFKRVGETSIVSKATVGFKVETLSRSYEPYGYVIDEAAMIRGGELMGVL